MAISRAQIMEYLVNRLKNISPKIEAVSLVNTEGLTLVTTMEDRNIEEKFSANAANVIDIASKVVNDLDRGEMRFVQIASSEGNLYIRSIDDSTLLAISVNSGADWNKIQLNIQRTIEDLEGLAEKEAE